MDKFLLNYDGNKYLETKKHLSEEIQKIGHIDIIAEPFCGIFGFSRMFFELTPDYKGEIWLNDINSDLINSLIQLQKNPVKLIKSVKKELLKYKSDHELSSDKTKSFILSLIARTLTIQLCQIDKAKRKLDSYDITRFTQIFKQIKFFNIDAAEFLKKLPKYKKCLVYFDPPYFNSNNTQYQDKMKQKVDKMNDYNDGTSIYITILNYFNKAKNDHTKNKICILAINKIDVINYIFKDYYLKDYEGRYQNIGKSKKKHIIYSVNLKPLKDL